ncbi:hypothetical protein AXF42_Ash007339 [Apostasia shenzhenica]|uniref:Uncharacterized protein n=1 Tax=Apostasia shenzhenica TaxID=1088818 RepID=A0A2I0B9W9_9ASPA|nr:hypothetical protein AXF42_Ash007339 [Apostasia shenzhenica]
MKIRTRIPETFLQLDGKMRKATATNNQKQLKIYLYFSQQILNSSLEILNVLHTSSGILIPTNGSTLNSRRFGYKVTGVSSIDIVTIYCETNTILSRQGSPVLAADPFTFLYDVQRPTVRLRTTADMRTREHNIPVIIKFVKAVFEFNSSSALISGGHLLSFHEISRSMYIVIIHAEDSILSVEVPENSARDVAGNSNLESNRLQVTHYSVPVISSIVSTIATAAFALTSMMALFLTVSTASLLSTGVFARTMTYLISEPTKNLARIACHIQVFALSKWLAVTLPVEYYELARGIGWSIPYLNLPWETKGMNIFAEDSGLPVVTYSKTAERNELNSFARMVATNVEQENKLHGKPLTPIEYRLFLENQNMMPEAEFIMVSRNSDVWKKFGRNMFWLAVIGGGLVALHFIFLLMLRFKRKRMEKQKEFGALVLPRFEIILLLLANPCICQASATLIRGQSTATTAVGAILLGVEASILVALLLFLSTGITLGKLLHYKEVHQEGQEFHWYHELIRVSLGPGKRGQWSWKNQSSSVNLERLGPLFEDLRGPPKYMLSQIAGGGNVGKQGDRIIASEDENEDAKAPFIQKLFGILRIYYTFIESAKRASLGVVAGAYSSENASKVPSLIVLSITSFQLLFLVLKKPFIKKKVQMVEIISVACEAGVLGACLVLLEEEFSVSSRRRIGYLMISLFVLSFVSQMMNEWYALYKQTVRLSPAGNSFCVGLKTSVFGLLLLVLPSNLLHDLKEFGATRGDGEGGELPLPPRGARRDSGEKPWLRQLRELAKASFSKEEGGVVNDPSSSRNWSGGLCAGKRSSSSSVTSSSDFKAKGEMKTKAKGLYRDLEAIFASK